MVDLRLSENQQRHACKELEAELSEQQEGISRLERSLKQAQFEMERRLVSQQKVCEHVTVATCVLRKNAHCFVHMHNILFTCRLLGAAHCSSHLYISMIYFV